MRVIAVGLALGMAVACGGTSSFESLKIERDVKEKGVVATREAMKMIDSRPEAAEIILRRHLKDVDDAIDKVKKDGLINDSDKTQMLKGLREYRSAFVKISEMPRAQINHEQEMQRIGRRF